MDNLIRTIGYLDFSLLFCIISKYTNGNYKRIWTGKKNRQ